MNNALGHSCKTWYAPPYRAVLLGLGLLFLGVLPFWGWLIVGEVSLQPFLWRIYVKPFTTGEWEDIIFPALLTGLAVAGLAIILKRRRISRFSIDGEGLRFIREGILRPPGYDLSWDEVLWPRYRRVLFKEVKEIVITDAHRMECNMLLKDSKRVKITSLSVLRRVDREEIRKRLAEVIPSRFRSNTGTKSSMK